VSAGLLRSPRQDSARAVDGDTGAGCPLGIPVGSCEVSGDSVPARALVRPTPPWISGVPVAPKLHEGLRMSDMSISVEALFDSALRLPSGDRARIAAELIASLDGATEAGVEAAWDAEVERRIAQTDQGEVQLLDWDDVKADVAQAVKRR